MGNYPILTFILLLILWVIWFIYQLNKPETEEERERLSFKSCLKGICDLDRKKTKAEEEEENNRDRNTYI